MPKIDFNLYLITDRLNLPGGTTLPGQVEAALRGGVKAVQLREKDLSPTELLPLAQEIRDLTVRYGVKLFINSCIETVQAVQADGIHLPSQNPLIAEARKILGPDILIGVSTHTLNEIDIAQSSGADFVTFGPTYPTPSKARYGDPVGLVQLKEACHAFSIPVFALGGITAQQIPELQAVDCKHVACIGAILQAENPDTAAKSLLKLLKTF